MVWMRNARLASLLCLAGFFGPCLAWASPSAEKPPTVAQTPKAEKPVTPPVALPGRSSRLHVVIEMDRGKLTIELFSEVAPKTLARFLNLIQKGFYNGLTFYRVVPKYLIQGGDPVGDGTGGSGQTIPAEFSEKKHQLGTVGMAHTKDSDSADSQFYICLEPQPFLDGKYTVFGQVVEGLDLLPKIQEGDVMRKVTIR
jgi:cyclophilin family peptidyl-prolyl cis-trans isomerase